MNQLVLKVNPLDNVLVALQPLQKGQSICFDKINYLIQSDIFPKHKFYLPVIF